MGESILIVDDDLSILTAIKMTLEGDFRMITAATGSEALKAVNEQHPDLILLDIGLPDMSGMEVLERIKTGSFDGAVIMITAVEETRVVVKALKTGAYDYLVKPIDAQELRVTVGNAIENRRLKDQIRHIQKPSVERYRSDLIAYDAQMKNLLGIAQKLAGSLETSVLIIGESGTGKGVLAKAIHYGHSDFPGPFVTVNCTAIPHDLFESELFGYDRGAFTGAKNEGRKGRFDESEGGTIFLDEIGSMSFDTQVKLLGVLEDRVYHRVGGNKPFFLSSRVIAATNSDLEKAVEEGSFRRDLYFRLNVVKLEIPPLRKRPDDIIPLALHFMDWYNKKLGKKFTGISTEAKRMMMEYSWPGNVRELRNTLERTVLLESGDVIVPEHLATIRPVQKPQDSPGLDFTGARLDYREMNRRLIGEALRRTRGNTVEAASLLNMPVHKLRYRIRKLGIRNA